MSYALSAPLAIAALIRALNLSPALAGVEVRDGPQITNAAALEVVVVGYQGAEDDAVADGTVLPEGLSGGRPDRESYSVHCAVSVLAGDDPSTAVATARNRACVLLAAVGDAITADRTLGRTVLRASPGSWAMRADETTAGMVTTIKFDVNIDAYTTR